MAQKVFKGFMQVTEGTFDAQTGYIYFVRKGENKAATDGYLQFNGKKYGTSAEAVAALEAKIGTLPEGYANLVSYVNDQISTVTGNFSSDAVSGESNGVQVTVGQANGNVTAVTVNAPDFAATYAPKSLTGNVETLETNLSAETAAREALSDRVDTIEENYVVSNDLTPINNNITALQEGAHTHSNKDVIDGITAQKVAAWDALAEGAEIVLSAYTGDNAGVTSGMLKSYEIFQGGVSKGKIDIPKDLVVSSGQIVEENGVKYLRLTIANSNTPVDIAVTDLVDVYTAGNGIEISASNEVSVKVVAANGLSVGANGVEMALADANNAGAMSAADFAKLASIDASAQANVIETVKVNGTALTVTDKAVDITLPDYSNTYAPIALTDTVADNKTAFDNYSDATDDRLDALETDTHTHSNKAVLDSIDDTAVNSWDDAADKAHEHSNKAVLDGITAEKVAAWDGVAGSADTRIAALEAVSAGTRLNALEAVSAGTRIAALEALTAGTASALQSISAADNSVAVGTKDASNNQTVGVKISATANNALSLNNDGLFAAIYYDGNDSGE